MATLARLQARSWFVGNQYYFRNRVVDEFRKKENDAAVKIQSWFRGCRIRAYIRYLHRVATIIQKCWRSYLGKKQYRHLVKLAHYTMKMNLYNAMAVKIQRRWRGYRIRKYCFNYYYLKDYLKAVSETNDAIREALEEFAEMKEREEKKANLEKEEKQRDYQARKMHYLLSTKQIPGIYNSPFRQAPDPWELRLQKAKPLTHPKPKGPFRDFSEVLEQRYKPLEPTLRVAEPINELKLAREEFKREECAQNIHSKMFFPFSSYHKKEKYTASMHSSSKYGSDSYGLKQFRSENPRKWICDKDFQTVLPSFYLFSKYGKLYSRAGQIV
ncbi:spermatogenesis-associated protein 17 isoform X3 [Marmota monax]|uniref:spermatogenesis-associated protein 17 isoform X3 n=1 Tax=Marmota monax TaxID=9995 RepID=UPI0026F19795|nr:spermatogenesis-associated protein 17 isoform X3 [Marmota monax]